MTLSVFDGLGTQVAWRTDASGVGGEAASGRHGAWQSAMEQAQMESWFKPGSHAAPSKELGNVRPRPLPSDNLQPALRIRVSTESRSSPAQMRADGPAPEVGGLSPLDAEPGLFELEPTPTPQDSGVASSGIRTPEPGLNMAPAGIVGGLKLEIRQFLARLHEGAMPAWMSTAVGGAAASGIAVATSGPQMTLPLLPSPPISTTPPRPLAHIAMSLPALTTPVAKTLYADEAGPAEEDGPASRTRRTVGALASAEGEVDFPLRVHVDWFGGGVRIWLGLNHDRAAAAPGLVRHLDQWFAASGFRLNAVVCNGRTIFSRYPLRSSE